ncbi:MAG: adenylate/guanylate cyclase domain-containing protein [Candidatus Omnitrophica bacterium]|nr:adenylate/guanylate cyclase domain-containing protein [Candidatus Omnitrophota bacterium]
MKPASPVLKKRWAQWVVPSLILAAAAALRIADPPLLEDVRLKVFDSFQKWNPRLYKQVPVAIVDIDDETLNRIGQWPWPRTQVAQLIQKISDLGAAAIALDIVFSEPDRTSPAQVMEAWPSSPVLEEIRPVLQELPEHDRVLAETISRTNTITGFVLVPEPNSAKPALKAGFAYGGADPSGLVPVFRGAVANLPEMEDAASGNGHFNMLPERDGILRRVPLLLELGGVLYPSLAAEALRVAQGASGYVVKSTGASGETGAGVATGVVAVKVGRIEIPTDAQGRVWLYDTGRIQSRSIPAWRIVEGAVDRSALEGFIVFIGSSASGLKDLRATPLNPAAGGTELHAQVVEQAVLGEFLCRPDWAPGAELFFLTLLGGLMIVLLSRLGAVWCAAGAVAALMAACYASWIAFARSKLLIDPVYPSLTVLWIYLIASLMLALRTESERRQVRQAFSRYVSPALVSRLAEHPELLKLGGELKPMTLLFVDIRGFTALAEQFTAEGLTQFMNRFLTPMTDIILKNNGTVDKYIGDCIMAFWNAPLEDPAHALHACQTALAMRQELVLWNKEQMAQYPDQARAPVNIGIGINTGICCVGNMGSLQRFDYSVLGDPVNLASRLEGQSKTYGVDIVIGEQTRQEAPQMSVLELDLITVQGKTKPIRIYALMGDQALKEEPLFQMLERKHAQMLEAYRQQRWDDARRLIDACLELETPVLRLRSFYALYRRRVDACAANPPGKDWNGVFAAVTK